LERRSRVEEALRRRRAEELSRRGGVHLTRLFLILAVLSAGVCLAVDLKPETAEAFDRYIASTESRMQPRWSGEHFLWFEESPDIRARLLAGAVAAQPIQGNGVVTLPGGLIQDWVGAVFVPSTTLKEVLSIVQDYPRHSEMYKPDVTDVKVQSHTGDDFLIRTRVVKSKFFISDVLDIENEIHFVSLDPKRTYSHSASRRVVEIANAGKHNEHELPPGHDRGLMWRINGYWFFEESDDGVFITCESITLTRDIPFLMAKLLSPILHELPEEALKSSLEQTRKAIVNQPRLTAP
jgi:hypothetical protein